MTTTITPTGEAATAGVRALTDAEIDCVAGGATLP